MANSVIPDSLVLKVWSKELYRDTLAKLYWNKFIGENSDSIVQKITDLKKKAGDSIILPMRKAIHGNAVSGEPYTSGGTTLEGNEQQLNLYDYKLIVDQQRSAVRLAGKLTEQKTNINLRTEMKTALSDWSSEYIDMILFSNICGFKLRTTRIITDIRDFSSYEVGVPYHSSRILNAHGPNSNINDIVAGDKLTCDIISKAKRLAITNLAANIIRPINIEGGQYYVMLINPRQGRDLRADAKWQDAQKYANDRGKDNPIFTGALGVYDGVVIHEHSGVFVKENGATPKVKVGYAALMGAQALGYAIAKEVSWFEKVFDYGNAFGVAAEMIVGFGRPQFGATGALYDYGAIQVLTSAVDD